VVSPRWADPRLPPTCTASQGVKSTGRGARKRDIWQGGLVASGLEVPRATPPRLPWQLLDCEGAWRLPTALLRDSAPSGGWVVTPMQCRAGATTGRQLGPFGGGVIAGRGPVCAKRGLFGDPAKKWAILPVHTRPGPSSGLGAGREDRRRVGRGGPRARVALGSASTQGLGSAAGRWWPGGDGRHSFSASQEPAEELTLTGEQVPRGHRQISRGAQGPGYSPEIASYASSARSGSNIMGDLYVWQRGVRGLPSPLGGATRSAITVYVVNRRGARPCGIWMRGGQVRSGVRKE